MPSISNDLPPATYQSTPTQKALQVLAQPGLEIDRVYGAIFRVGQEDTPLAYHLIAYGQPLKLKMSEESQDGMIAQFYGFIKGIEQPVASFQISAAELVNRTTIVLSGPMQNEE